MERTFAILWNFEGIQEWEEHHSVIPTGMSNEDAIAQATNEVLSSLTKEGDKSEKYLAGVLMFLCYE